MGISYADGIAPPPGAPMLGNVAYIPPGFEDCFKVPFSYVVTFASIGATTQTQTVNINNDSYFAATEQIATIWDAATQDTTHTLASAFPAFVNVLDTSSGRNLMNGPVPIAAYFGDDAGHPFVWLYRAQVFRPGGQITVQLNVLSAGPFTVTLTFTGFKLYTGVPDVGSNY
jgi:hypothetical protein